MGATIALMRSACGERGKRNKDLRRLMDEQNGGGVGKRMPWRGLRPIARILSTKQTPRA